MAERRTISGIVGKRIDGLGAEQRLK